MKKTKSKPLTPEQIARIDSLANLPDECIDTSDIPEITDFSGGRRGLLYRPRKQHLSLRLDADLIEWFKRNAEAPEGYQTRINRALREYVQHHAEPAKKTAARAALSAVKATTKRR